ncbi:MAG TPA: metal-dependent hydrolase [Acidobacteriaceae bacterium]|jgi:inner membrane protein
MEPVTHILTGICLARTGLNRRAAYTTLAMAIAAELPDIDTLWGFAGPVASFQHHRGITHTFIGLPVEAALVVAAMYGLHRWRASRPNAHHANHPLTAAPVCWGWLTVFVLLALLSHLFLDFTNNYGIRPFFPFNPHWYAGSITFIFDPLMFALLLGAAVLPALFRLVGSEVGSRRQAFAARGWAISALLALVVLWTFRETQHSRAITLANAQSLAVPVETTPVADAQDTPSLNYLQPLRVLANPDPFNPFRWWMVTDYGPVYQLAQADTRNGTFKPAQQTTVKIAPSPEFQAAANSRLGRVYLDWSPMPFLSISHTEFDEAGQQVLAPGHTLVVFRDPRFMADLPGLRNRAPLEGKVELDAQNRVVRETMN